eukprot:CAMPEP_0174355576 /NCGR_PEP_ID=MMETSP0811_2-20130205/25693_1 /TAXON_ID=73025 ORGANISM="Eutreptiella gymnastica-like, Strain CCMP1594" /NCGR_SAMPLE_ID=MMETSP0811_2 /ASSEMBLY_ACC=CAM_ASM_000667 /LENGTH=87 /DNA_ID=CAMNT_0015486995 /DNA_START=312 /DNA_END=572 /DNA_ORIENTATION=-
MPKAAKSVKEIAATAAPASTNRSGGRALEILNTLFWVVLRVAVTGVSRQHEQMKSRILAIANIRIAQGSTDVRETTSAYARGQPGWA